MARRIHRPSLIALLAAALLAAPAAARADDAFDGAVAEASAGDDTVEKRFVVVAASPDHGAATRLARLAARRLGVALSRDELRPNLETGLTEPRAVCEASGFEYPCYVPRGREDDGVYVSVEHSDSYEGFGPGLYLVVVASGPSDSREVATALRRARSHYPGAYARTAPVYIGCLH